MADGAGIEPARAVNPTGFGPVAMPIMLYPSAKLEPAPEIESGTRVLRERRSTI